MIIFFHQIRDIFNRSYSKTYQIYLSRKAFFQLLGYLGSCVVISLVAQSRRFE
ncbi:Mco6p PWA37_005262 [Arxiozyma heterogenica]|uniref:Mco6p n=1 Tax=Arxiozyma heterogenica TaxID=278026 RepID=UPI002EF3A6C3